MAKAKTAETETAEEVVAVVAEKPAEKAFPLENLAKNCRKLFGVSSATFAGATAGLEGKAYSVAEMKSIIETWCGKGIK